MEMHISTRNPRAEMSLFMFYRQGRWTPQATWLSNHIALLSARAGPWELGPNRPTELQHVHHDTLVKCVDLGVVTYVCNLSTWESLSLSSLGQCNWEELILSVWITLPLEKPLLSRSQNLLNMIWLSGFVHDTWSSQHELKTQVFVEWMDEYMSNCTGIRR